MGRRKEDRQAERKKRRKGEREGDCKGQEVSYKANEKGKIK